jgi:hypothetical protein
MKYTRVEIAASLAALGSLVVALLRLYQIFLGWNPAEDYGF